MSSRTFMKAIKPNKKAESKEERSISLDYKVKSYVKNPHEIQDRSNTLTHRKIKLEKFGRINQQFSHKNYEILNNKVISSIGMTINGKNEKNKIKTNQDSYFILNNVFDINYNIFGVLDGHGPNGHQISSYIKDFFKDELTNIITYDKTIHINQITSEIIYNSLKNNDYEFIKKLFFKAHNQLINTNFEYNFSGTTCVLVFIIDYKVISANCGDSKAIIYQNNKNIVKISKDHKFEIKEERDRILLKGGYISKTYDGNENVISPLRIWVKGEKYPGLAMSRAIGDYIANSIGVSSVPDVFEYIINNKTNYIVIASDGIWEFMDEENVCEVINPFYDKNDLYSACKKLIKRSKILWKEFDIVRDDITVVIVFIK